MEELEELGVFADNYSGSSELADIRHFLFSDKNVEEEVLLEEEKFA